MPIPVTCPSCLRKVMAPSGAAGHRVKCPGCGEPFFVPVPRTEPRAPAPVAVAEPRPPEDYPLSSMPRGNRMVLAGLAVVVGATLLFVVIKVGMLFLSA